MSFLAPMALLGALVAIPIILLYVLRLRRREVVVSNHFLWQRVLQDQQANTPFQRLRRNILLFLQLLIVGLLVLALARPALFLPALNASRVVVLLDASASMNATEGANGQTRWQLAQVEAERLIAQLGTRDEMAILRVAEQVDLLSEYTNNAVQLRGAIQDAQPSNGGADWDTALTIALSGREGQPSFALYVITDGGLDTFPTLPVTAPAPRVISVGMSQENVAISAFGSRSQENQVQLFAQVTHYGTQPILFDLTIRLDGILWQSQRATLNPNTQSTFVFAVDRPFTTAQASLVLPTSVTDALSLDNVAFTVSDSGQSRRVLIISPSENRFLSQVFGALPNVETFNGDASRATLPQTPYDLYVFDRYLPDVLPDADVLMIAPPRSHSGFILGTPQENRAPLTLAEPSHPLMRFLSVEAVNVRTLTPLQPIDEMLVPLLWAESVGALWASEQGELQRVIVPFALQESDFALQIAFPIFIANALEWFIPPRQVSPIRQAQVGDVVPFSLPLQADSVRVTFPSGDNLLLPRDGALTQTGQLGIYQLEALSENTVLASQAIALNAFDPRESNITPRTPTKERLGGGNTETTDRPNERASEGWGVVLMGAFVVLLVEWWVSHRPFRRGVA